MYVVTIIFRQMDTYVRARWGMDAISWGQFGYQKLFLVYIGKPTGLEDYID